MNDRHVLTVVYYHSVGPVNPGWEKSFLTLGESLFEEHLAWLQRRYTTISLTEYLQIRSGLRKPVKNPLVISFDDGYLDNWVYAFPLLKRYGMKGTIFVSPDFVDPREICRPDSGELNAGEGGSRGSSEWGFLSWEEMRKMESSGLIDIQSHSLTHTKYFVTDRLTGFHHPGGNILYPVINQFPEIRPYYIGMDNLERLLPWGYPLFEEKPALTARKVLINPAFIDECVKLFGQFDFTIPYDPGKAFRLAEPLYNSWKESGRLVLSCESDREYEQRVWEELVTSKKIIEEKLDKRVDVLCWPHGANNSYLHEMALRAGYLMTTTGKAAGVRKNDVTRIPDRAVVDLTSPARKVRTIFRMRAFSGKTPYYQVLNLSRKLRRL